LATTVAIFAATGMVMMNGAAMAKSVASRPARADATTAAPLSSPAPAADAPGADGESTADSSETRSTPARGGKKTGYPVPDERLRKNLPPPPSGNIHLFDPYRNESLKINIFNLDGSYNLDALKAVSHFLRCKRTDTETQIEPRLLAILSHIYDHFGDRRIEVTSGYRNQVHTTSNHYRGSASDITIPGIAPKKLRAFAESLDAGGMGIGLYPTSGFVHVDVRPPPSYRWIDYSATDPGDPKRRPPPNVKRKRRLQS
jgi:uncharacterized protein YcbK (DUF882 family)